MRYGYVRDSLGSERHIEKQLKMIGEVDVIIQDTDKSKLRDLLENKVQSGDSIHISDMSIVTRDVEESLRLFYYLLKKNVAVYVNQERGAKYFTENNLLKMKDRAMFEKMLDERAEEILAEIGEEN